MAICTISSFQAALIWYSFATAALAQTCWYPDGVTVSTDTTCDASTEYSACCAVDRWCLGDGLCYGSGVLSRASCTDKNWGVDCPQYCVDDPIDSGAYITPCSSGYFSCGLGDTTNCSVELLADTNIILRDYQLGQTQTSAVEISPNENYTCDSLANATASSTAEVQTVTVTAFPSGGGYGTADIAGAAVGVGMPLLLALAAAVFMIFRLRKKVREAEGRRRNGENARPYYTDTVGQQVPIQKQVDAAAMVSELETHNGRQELGAGYGK